MSIFDPYGTGYNPGLIQYPELRRVVPNPPQVNNMGRDLEKVNGLESARQYPMQPNSRVALFDINSDVMYIKETDASNFPTIRIFKFYEETMQNQVPQQIVEEPKYLTIEEFNKFKEELFNGQQSIRYVSESTGTSANNRSKPKKHNADV